MEIAPTIMTKMEIAQAKIGRAMKKRLISVRSRRDQGFADAAAVRAPCQGEGLTAMPGRSLWKP